MILLIRKVDNMMKMMMMFSVLIMRGKVTMHLIINFPVKIYVRYRKIPTLIPN